MRERIWAPRRRSRHGPTGDQVVGGQLAVTASDIWNHCAIRTRCPGSSGRGPVCGASRTRRFFRPRCCWPAPSADDTRLVVTAHALRRRPIGELIVEDMRLLIGQDITVLGGN
ncbi:contact-dependent growth inhibition system immunity protein [Streptomyces sp. NPDC005525]|uniref:contact-dependent growth inhibition system immunity protein n=1 Tax=Streptomyces sp. NPDC005525 TaxID=3364720 RepID=UPI0036BABAAF